MKENQASQLIAHIEEAEDWLHKARAEFHQSNPIRGELILNLAQAEVKHAWELSRRQFVLRTSGKDNRNFNPNLFVSSGSRNSLGIRLDIWDPIG